MRGAPWSRCILYSNSLRWIIKEHKVLLREMLWNRCRCSTLMSTKPVKQRGASPSETLWFSDLESAKLMPTSLSTKTTFRTNLASKMTRKRWFRNRFHIKNMKRNMTSTWCQALGTSKLRQKISEEDLWLSMKTHLGRLWLGERFRPKIKSRLLLPRRDSKIKSSSPCQKRM